MSTSTAVLTIRPDWVTADEFAARGFTPGGPETDYGMRWGRDVNIRASYAPFADQRGGYLYAYDSLTDRYAVLAAHTTPDRADSAWQVVARTSGPDGYLTLGQLASLGRPLRVERAQELWAHCVTHEITARAQYPAAPVEQRFDAARAVVVAEAARTAAEQLVLDAVRDRLGPETEPVVVRYRVLGQAGWTGRVIADDLATARVETSRLADLAARHGFQPQLTSVEQGNAAVAAARVRELDGVGARPAGIGL